jgi:hypothetical protein
MTNRSMRKSSTWTRPTWPCCRRSWRGAAALARRPGWTVVYYDDLAVILARDVARFPELRSLSLPVAGPKSAVEGRAPFPRHSARWQTGLMAD